MRVITGERAEIRLGLVALVLIGLIVWLVGGWAFLLTLGLAAMALTGVVAWLLLRFWPRAAFLLLVAAVYADYYRLEIGPVSIRAEQVVILILLGLLVIRLLYYERRPWLTVPGLYAAGWWLALSLSAYLHAPDFEDTIRHIIRLALMVLIMVVTINLITSQAEWQLAFRTLYLLGLVEAAYGILARALYAWDFGEATVLGMKLRAPLNLGVQVAPSFPVPVPYGTMEEGNIFGSTMAALLVVSLVLWIQPAARISRRTAALGTLLTFVAWILSLARAAWLALVLVLPALWVLYPPRGERRVRHLQLLLVGAPLSVLLLMGVTLMIVTVLPADSPVLARLETLTDLGSDPTFSLRLQDWSLALDDIRQRPFIGWGPGTFLQLHGLRHGTESWLQSLTLKNLQEGGIPGLLFMYGLWGTLLWDGLRQVLGTPSRAERSAVLALVMGLLVLFISYHATDATWLGFVWVWMGCLAATQTEALQR